jgi:choline dehydrogenase/4-pyridoxate dehydrogenase
MTVLPTRYQAFVSTTLSRDIPDIQLLAGGATLAAHPWFPGIKAPFTDMASFFAAGLHPKSRGRVTLRSRDPHAKPHIVQNFFAEPDDLATIREGVQFIRQLIATEPLASALGKEVAPGGNVIASAAIDQYIRASARTAQHPAGTCRMGTDPQAVVDGALRVRGIEALRVVDASVMPDLVGGNINAAVVMIAERAADVILGNTLPPARVRLRRPQPVPA